MASGLHEVEHLWSLDDLCEAHDIADDLDEAEEEARREASR